MTGSSGGGGDGGRKKRRHPTHGKSREAGTSSGYNEAANRERIFQDIEGRMRQIRELAEEGNDFTNDEISELTQSVVALFRSLESEGEVVSDRAFAEYQRLRERLNQALRTAPTNEAAKKLLRS
jgi:hypothetical protein